LSSLTPGGEGLSAAVDQAAESATAAETPSATPADAGEPAGTRDVAGAGQTESEQDIGTWVAEIEKAVVRARDVDTPAAWQIAARAAGVVSDIAQTMLAMTQAHQIVDQTARAAEVAGRQAHEAAQAAEDARRTAEQTTRAAEVAGRQAQEAAQAAAKARESVDELDQMVARARETNTPNAWSEALRIASEVRAMGIDDTTPPARETDRPA